MDACRVLVLHLQEDTRLRQLVAQFGCKKWSHIASFLHGRLGKQCRERYYNHLNPVINKGPWTPEEDQIIIVRQIEFPNKWANIAREVNGRYAVACHGTRDTAFVLLYAGLLLKISDQLECTARESASQTDCR